VGLDDLQITDEIRDMMIGHHLGGLIEHCRMVKPSRVFILCEKRSVGD
jgi:hypothetical protein